MGIAHLNGGVKGLPQRDMCSVATGKQRSILREAAPWLEYKGRWGSSVEAPAQQEWFAKAENPVSRSFWKQVRETQSFPECQWLWLAQEPKRLFCHMGTQMTVKSTRRHRVGIT